MKNIVLIRHAKSSWDIPLKDIDRPLEKRGVRDAHLVSSNIQAAMPNKYIIWSSPAKRASETALIFAQNTSYPEESIVYKEGLYTFDEKELEETIKSCNNAYDSLILFGHNGAITDFVNKFGDVFISNVPTSGVVAIQFDSDDWKKIGRGKTKKIVTPKDLKLKNA